VCSITAAFKYEVPPIILLFMPVLWITLLDNLMDGYGTRPQGFPQGLPTGVTDSTDKIQAP
jgi:hypothetical protein